MSDGDRSSQELPIEQAERLELVLGEFKSAWESDSPLRIEYCLAREADFDRSVLLAELLQIEIALRRRQGEEPTTFDYRWRFPADVELLQRLLSDSDGPAATDSSLDPDYSTVLVGSDEWGLQDLATRSQAAHPSRVGPYVILEEIARGGMGVVFKARHSTLGRMAAIKLIRSGEFAEETEVRRFQIEAAAAAQLDHPGIVPVYEVGQHVGQHYMALAYVDGPNLWQRMQKAPLAPLEAAQVMQKVAEAVQYAHEQGIIHRDLKPQNILLTNDGRPRVTDFGLAKRYLGDSNLTETGQLLGTPHYVSPEQAAGKQDQVGPHSDVYSLGATLYYLLTGRPPFRSDSIVDTVQQLLEKRPAPPSTINLAVPMDLETICLKCLEKEPALRYASARALAEDLQRAIAAEPIAAQLVSDTPKYLKHDPPGNASKPRQGRFALRAKAGRLGCGMTVVVSLALLIASRLTYQQYSAGPRKADQFTPVMLVVIAALGLIVCWSLVSIVRRWRKSDVGDRETDRWPD